MKVTSRYIFVIGLVIFLDFGIAEANTAVPVVLSYAEGGLFGSGGIKAIVLLGLLLPALLEWPFLRRAGISRLRPLHALIANLISLSVGITISDFLLDHSDWLSSSTLLLLWLWLEIPFLVACSILIEGAYYRLISPTFRWKPIVWANIISAGPLLLIALPEIWMMSTTW